MRSLLAFLALLLWGAGGCVPPGQIASVEPAEPTGGPRAEAARVVSAIAGPATCLAGEVSPAAFDPTGAMKKATHARFERAQRTGDYADVLAATGETVNVGRTLGAGAAATAGTSGGARLWCVELKPVTFSGDSRTPAMRLHVSALELPQGTRLALYDPKGDSLLAGPFADAGAARAALEEELCYRRCGRFSTMLAYYVPAGAPTGTVQLNEATLAYPNTDDLGSSLACHVNAAPREDCTATRDWQRAIRSTVQIVRVNFFGGRLYASGVLLNTTAGDGTPYVLTAAHEVGNDQGDDLNAGGNKWFFRFGYQPSVCGSAPVQQAPSSTVVAGGRVEIKSRTGDFALIRLSEPPPASSGAVYAGWSLDEAPPGRSAFVGYPLGDVAKIAFEDDPLEASGGRWRAQVDRGAVQYRMSGSPLFNEEQQVIGHLTGGWNGKCAPAQGYNFFPRLAAIWEKGAPGERLRDFLDPQNTGRRSVPALVP